MPIAPTYPGVYIEEIPSGVRTIVGVPTSIGAFVDFFPVGPLNTAVQILSLSDFEKQFGGLDVRSEASYAIQQFFLNGGTEAYVVRVTSGTSTNAAATASIALMDAPGGTVLLTAAAMSPGIWGNNVLITVDYACTDPTTMFNLTVTEVAIGTDGIQQVVTTEVYRNLVIGPNLPNDAAAIVNAGSQLITLTSAQNSAGKRPAMTGTLSPSNPDPTKAQAGKTLQITLNTNAAITTAALANAQTTLSGLASALQSLIQAADKSLAGVTVSVIGSASNTQWLVVEAGTNNPSDIITVAGDIGTELQFVAGGINVQQYALGGKAVQAQALPGSPAAQQSGSDGKWDPVGDAGGVVAGVNGDPNLKSGLWALMDVDIFNLLCLPVTANLPDTQAAAIAAQAENLCTQRRAMYILDIPQQAASRDTVTACMTWLDKNASIRSRNAALYFPRLSIPDPLNNYSLRPTPPSGTIAGLYARTDSNRGVWKAPAGTEATLTNVQQLQYKATDPENGVLNPVAINCLRNFPVYGPVCWGARTLYGADQMEDDYKYVPIRRLALYIEESLYRGTQWAVFEPNDEPLWSQIRLNVGTFMQGLFRQGAFQGQSPQTAYFVKCDSETTPQDQINLGIVNVIVGFAPLKPAEFVVIQIQQMAGQLDT